MDFCLIGQSIKARRKELKFTQIELAKELNMAQGYLADIENGKAKNPSLNVLNKIANFLEMDMNRLFAAAEKADNDDFDITKDEKELIKLYRQLPNEMQVEIRGEIKGILRMTNESSSSIEKEEAM